MSVDTFYLRQSVRDMDESPAYQPISRIRINAGTDSDGNAIIYEAGNSNGRTIEVDNPIILDSAMGSAVAQRVLSTLEGYKFKPFKASGAILDPAAEIGDAVSVNGVYSVLADIETTFSPLMTANISAPEDGSIDHEYPYESPTDRAITRSIADLTTSFIVENGRIAAEISSVAQTTNGLSTRITSIETTVNGIHAYTNSEIQTIAGVVVDSWAEANFTSDGIETLVGNKFDAAGAAATALQNAKQYTDDEIAPIAGEYQSAINQKANEITATVAAAETKWDLSELPSGVSISAYGYGNPNGVVSAGGNNRNKYYLDQSTGRYYRSNGTSWVLQTQQLHLITSNIKAAVEINANDIRSVVSDMSDTQSAVSSISQRVDSITMYVSSANGSTTFTLTDGEAILDTKTVNITVDSFNVVGPITATSVAANSYIQAPIIYDMGGWGYLHMESVSSSGQLIYASSSSASIGSSYWGIAADPISGPVSMYIAGIEMMRGSVYLPGYVYLYGTWDFRGATVYLPS